MLYSIFNARMLKVGWVNANSKEEALAHAKRLHPAAAVERILSPSELRQKAYEEEAEMWSAINRSYR